jgi:succinoglycan biosynthesis transport protein ExoP
MNDDFEQPIDLREHLAILRVRKWTVLAVIAVAVGIALAYSLRQTPLYSAEARVLVKPISSNEVYIPPPNLETEAEILASEPVAELVREDLGVQSPASSLLGGVAVEAVTETEVLVVNYTSADPGFARDAAESFAQSYVDYRRNVVLKELVSAREAIEKQVAVAERELTGISRDIQRARAANDRSLQQSLEIERSGLISRLGSLEERLSNIQPEQAVSLGGGEVIETASLPSAPSSPNHVRNGLVGFLFGILFGIGAAFLRDRLDDRLRGRGDIERTLDAPLLATVAKFRTPKNTFELPVRINPRGAASEAYRTLRTNVQFIAAQQNLKSFVVTSPVPGEGKTVTCANLAVALAQAGSRVICVSGDLRRPTLERYFSLGSSSDGLSTWLSGTGGEDELIALIRNPGIPYLRVLTSGPIPPNPPEVLASPRLMTLVSRLEANADIVLFDSAPTLSLADTVVLASRVVGTLLVIDAGSTRRSATIHARQELERVGARIIGSVLNSFDPSNTPYYYPSYYSAYESQPIAAPNGQLTESPAQEKKRSRFGLRS